MPRASCTRRPGDTASRCRGRGTYSPDASRSTSPPSPGEEPRAYGRVRSRTRALPPCARACSWLLATNPGLIRVWLLPVARGLESWPDLRLALAGGSWPRILA